MFLDFLWRVSLPLFGALLASCIPAYAESPPIDAASGRSAQAEVGGQRGQEPWARWLRAHCASLAMYKGRESACLQDYDALRVALESAEQQPVAPEWLLPSTPPSSGWGIDPLVAANLSLGGAHYFELLVGREDHLVVHVSASGRQIWIDAYSGQVLAHENRPPGLSPVWQKQHSFRLGVPQAMMLTADHFTLIFSGKSCGSPLSFGGTYLLETSPGQTLGTPTIFRRFGQEKKTLFPGSCEGEENAAFEADFRPLALGIAGRFPDGTLLLVAQDLSAGGENDIFMFRAHYDLSSPFFHGRTDYVRITPDALPSVIDPPDLIRRELDTAIMKAVTEQAASK